MGLFDTVLVPIDGTAPSEAGAALATEIARTHGGEIVFVHVVDLGSLAVTSDYAAIDAAATAEEAENAGRRLVDESVARAQAAGAKARGRILEGSILEQTVQAAREERASLIVIGSHGRGGLIRAILGSITEGLLRRSPVPVLVAPHIKDQR